MAQAHAHAYAYVHAISSVLAPGVGDNPLFFITARRPSTRSWESAWTRPDGSRIHESIPGWLEYETPAEAQTGKTLAHKSVPRNVWHPEETAWNSGPPVQQGNHDR